VSPPNRYRLVLVRHGETPWNVEGRFQGQADPEMNANGWAQARQAAADLRDLEPAAVISSDLARAVQTACVIAAPHGLEPVATGQLREVDLGTWTGLTRSEAARQFPAEFEAWSAGRPVRRGGGETPQEAGARVAIRVLAAVHASAPGATLLVVSHGLALRAGILQLRQLGVIETGAAGQEPHLRNGAWIGLDANLT
jgi:broad specificity phosphatase PhoE